MELIRTFHPIGQGAFYSERHYIRGTEFTIVYDCGSTTLQGKKFERKIKSTFPKDHSIDVLFISHFHADHINGIEILAKHCNIKKVVLPLIDNTAKTLLKVANLIENNFLDTRLIDDPDEFFGKDIPIIRIETNNFDQESVEINTNISINISEVKNSENFPSGTVFKSFLNNDWLFIPFNYEHQVREKQFEKAIKNEGLSLVEIDSINKIIKNKSIIIKAYKDVDGDLNKNSMILFSGKKMSDRIHCFDHNTHFYFIRHLDFQSGCLYLGDIDLNEPNIVKDINSKLKQFLPFIGTLQVPHHGSIHNFVGSILQKDVCAVISFGTTNTYGHPSDRVLGEIIANQLYPRMVTENQKSIVIQWKPSS
ncbi:MBL fold metallo-hydrolase [Cognataquiflexum rubidum]|uniref:MBL fold metallo-hydrolase n=1 Tax=Cognataquiflexum rubidum TaxID=2922273 RepID=UPI001F12918D|nr:MBL fold metallo-hydrolase [Cognataquiflexum rubidum]MCH6233982.1 MBL fold metallo-hydrolase [Cognataquiflexum rubidum]